MSVFTAELVGTFLLILLGGGVCANVSLKKTGGHNSGWIVITAGWGLAVAIAVRSEERRVGKECRSRGAPDP